MDKNINIINSKDNTLEFDIEIEGIKPNDTKCFFVIKTADVNFSFECKENKSKWNVIIPRMPQIKDTMYQFYIYMVIDGYYFEPYSGSLNVMKSADVYVKDISNKTFEPTKPVENMKHIDKISIADKIFKETKAPNMSNNDQKVKDILEQTGLSTPKKHINLKKGKIIEI